MPLPAAAPIAATALKYAAVAAAAWWAVRRLPQGRIDQRWEDALDGVDEGLTATTPRDRDQVNLGGRLRRVVRMGTDGPGLEIDLTALARLRLRRI
ncbi:MAG: hypothetical protein JJU40_07175 [Rhodobacteraceae bacterium]|nr:hypothetical protein [Paracoccaceae bacterium]